MIDSNMGALHIILRFLRHWKQANRVAGLSRILKTLMLINVSYIGTSKPIWIQFGCTEDTVIPSESIPFVWALLLLIRRESTKSELAPCVT